MKGKAIYKVPNGKLLKIYLDYDKRSLSINNINIMGDFFVYPEESIEKIENELKKSKIKRELLIKRIGSIIKNEKIEFIGFNEESLADGIMMCLE